MKLLKYVVCVALAVMSPSIFAMNALQRKQNELTVNARFKNDLNGWMASKEYNEKKDATEKWIFIAQYFLLNKNNNSQGLISDDNKVYAQNILALKGQAVADSNDDVKEYTERLKKCAISGQ